MKPNFALNLTDDRISLLHRTAQGWANLGIADFGADDMDARLADMLAAAQALAPRGVTTKIVIPNSQILYTTVDVAPGPVAARRDDIRAALAGRTPYAVEDLVFDFAGEGDRVQVAVLAQETLDQAEGFAVQYNFRPVGFVGIPPEGAFDGEPYFGLTKAAPGLLGKGRRVERDTAPIALLAVAAAEPVAETIAAPVAEEQNPFPESEETYAPQPTTPQLATPQPVAEVMAEPPVWADPEPVIAAVIEAPADMAEVAVEPAAPEPLEPAPEPRRFSGVVDPQVVDMDEAPFADVSETDTPDAPVAAADDIPPAPSTAALMAFASRRAAAAGGAAATTLPPRPMGETTMPGNGPSLIADRMAARAAANARPEPRVTMGAPMVAPAQQGGKKQRKAVVGGAAAPAIAASVAADLPRKPLTKPGGTFASSAPVRGKPRFLGLILTGILILFLALLAAWSSFFLASQSDPAVVPATAVAAADAPDIEDEALADGQEPEGMVVEDGAAAVAPAADPVPETDIAAGPDPAALPADQTLQPETAGPAPETGVVTTGPAPVQPDAVADEILLSTADTPLALQEAANLAAPELQGDAAPVAQMAPPPFGTVYEFNANGTVRAVPDGIMTPDGVRLVAGSPASVPPARPAVIAAAVVPEVGPDTLPAVLPAVLPGAAPEAAPVADDTTIVGSDPALADARPRARPQGLVPPGADDDAALQSGGAVLASSPRPLPRPAAIVAANAVPDPARASDAASLAAASAAAGTAAEAIILDLAAAEPTTPSGSRLAVSVSRIPAPRPRDMERAVAAALKAATRAPAPEPEPEPEPEPAPEQMAAATPEQEPEPEVEAPVSSAPTSGSVADRATFVNALNLSRINLIGVYGTQSNRYALIRQSNGRYKRVEVGDRIDGGVVAAITATEVRYQKGGRLIALQMPDS